MFIDYFLNIFEENRNKEAIIWKNKSYNYEWLLKQIQYWSNTIDSHNIKPHTVVALEGDFSPNSIALLFALIEKPCIIVPLTNLTSVKKEKLFKIAQVEFGIYLSEDDEITTEKRETAANHDFYKTITQREHPGLVLFTSGTSGEPKAAVHDFIPLLEKFKTKRKSLKTLNFLLFDHWGGLNTMLHILSNAGTVTTIKDRSPDSICNLIEKFQIELLPGSPTFLNLLLVSEAYKRHDLASLKIISYGTEPMPENTLKRLKTLFPYTKFQQTYGLIELGVLRSKSKSSDSLWVKIGGEGFETRVIDGLLQIKAKSAMLGYINAPSPFTEDGWFKTGDAVEVDGEYLKILGRKSENINVGGEKVYPAEVESVVQEIDNIAEVTVYGEKNPITGKIVCAKIRLKEDEDHKQFTINLKKHCRERLESFKVPVKVKFVEEKQHGDRFKKIRR